MSYPGKLSSDNGSVHGQYFIHPKTGHKLMMSELNGIFSNIASELGTSIRYLFFRDSFY